MTADTESVRSLPVTSKILSRLYPATCVLCGAPGQGDLGLCAGCLADLPTNRNCCKGCAQPFGPDHPIGVLCGQCLQRPPPFATCHAAFCYTDPLPALVGGAKFRSRLDLLRLFGQCLALFLRERTVEIPDSIIPVPLHPKRLRERGYNQAMEIARVLGRELAIPVDPDCCVRVMNTTPQMGLAQKERLGNIRGAFRTRYPPAGDRVAIIDDVMTTGSTVSELTRVLLKAGVERVDVWAVARTP